MHDNGLIFLSNFKSTRIIYFDMEILWKFDDVFTFYKNIISLKLPISMMTSLLESFFLGFKINFHYEVDIKYSPKWYHDHEWL